MVHVRSVIVAALVISLASSSIPAKAQLNPFSGLGAALGNGNGGNALAGAIIGVAMATIIQKLSEQERENRQTALQRAARSGSASWRTAGKDGKKASYKRVGAVSSVGNQKCQMVEEQITLANGERGTSRENVCFNS
jgi:uncharacterized protein YdbL (DUF1318 family)